MPRQALRPGVRAFRCGQAALWLRKRFYNGRSGEKALALARELEKFQRDHQQYKRGFGQVDWLPVTYETTVEEVLFAAADQGLTFGALDAEYYTQRGRVYVTEIGFSYYTYQRFHNHHYVINGGKVNPRPYVHGASTPCGLGMAGFELEQLMARVDVVLMWNRLAEDRVLESCFGLKIPEGKGVDVQGWQRRPEPSRGYATPFASHYSLEEFCMLQGVTLNYPHNAGNDARALLDGVLHGLGILGDPVVMEEVRKCG